MKLIVLKLRAGIEILRYFRNPLLVSALRLGLVKIPYFLYRITKNRLSYTLLARPTTTSLADLFVLREVFLQETYRDILPLLGQETLRIVDVGANLGAFTIWLHRKRGVREAFCFEPEADSYRLLMFNLAKNDCGFATTIPSALGGRVRTVQMRLKRDSPGGTSIYGTETVEGIGQTNYVPVLAFEEWMRAQAGDFDVLKLDCEGAEWEIVRNSSAKQLTRFRVIVAEIHGDPEANRPCAELAEMIAAKGFRTVRWDGHAGGLYIGIREGTR